MFETPIALVGNIVTDVDRRRVGDQDLTRFRVASNSRKKGADGSWQPGNTLYVTVTCWGSLANGVGGSLFKGDPVVVVGHLFTNEYTDRDDNKRSTIEIRATAVGPDLSRSIARVSSTRRSHAVVAPAAEPGPVDGDERDAADEDACATDDVTGVVPLSA